MSSPPKKMRKSGSSTAVASSVAQNQAVQTKKNDLVDDVNMEEELDASSMYEDEEGKLSAFRAFIYQNFIAPLCFAKCSICNCCELPSLIGCQLCSELKSILAQRKQRNFNILFDFI